MDNERVSEIEKINKEFMTVVRVVDGDTVILENLQGDKKRVWLVGLNSPEAREINGRIVECFGEESSQRAKQILKNRKIFFELNSNDHYDK